MEQRKKVSDNDVHFYLKMLPKDQEDERIATQGTIICVNIAGIKKKYLTGRYY